MGPAPKAGNSRFSACWTTPIRWLAVLALLTVGAAGLTACERHEAPLIDLLGISPRYVAEGDRLELLGRNLPPGKRATLVLEGAVFRPGAPPRRGVVARGEAISQPDRAVGSVTKALQHALVGDGPAARHATFRGQASLLFDSAEPGAPKVSGTLREVVLDIDGKPLTQELQAEQAAESSRFLSYLGVSLERLDPPFKVSEVAQNGLAHRAGIKPGDVIIELDSLNLMSLADFAPRPDATQSDLLLRRGNNPSAVSITLPTGAFHRQPPTSVLATVIGLAAFALSLALCFFTPIGRNLRWLGPQLAWRSKEVFAPAAPRFSPRQRSTTFVGWAARAVLTLGVLASFAWLSRADVSERASSFLYAGLAILLLLGALIAGGRRPLGTWSLSRALKSAFFALTHLALIFASLSHVAVRTGTMDLERVALAQGAAPWLWNAFSSPLSLLAFSLYLLCLVPSYAPQLTRLPLAHLHGDTRAPSVVDWFFLSALSALGVVFFLGGWRHPGETQAAPTLIAVGLSVVLFFVKTLCLFALGLFTRLAVRSVSILDLGGWLWTWVVPAGALLAVITPWANKVSLPTFVVDGSRIALLVFFSLVMSYLALQVALAWRSKRPELGIHPWV